MKHNQRYNILQLILQGKIEEKTSVGRRRIISWMKNLRDWYNTTSIDLFRASLDRNDIANQGLKLRYFATAPNTIPKYFKIINILV